MTALIVPPMSDRLADVPDLVRLATLHSVDREAQASLGQFMTPPGIARFMAGMFSFVGPVSVLDAGAGLGSLTAATIEAALKADPRPNKIRATCFELDGRLTRHLQSSLLACKRACRARGVSFTGEVQETDFVSAAESILRPELGRRVEHAGFTHAILNPPYKKLNTKTPTRESLRRVGLETSNLYAAFLGLAILLLKQGGELVAITPRSFCNGPYFKPFRELLLSRMSLRRIHVFESRTLAFSRDDVLQETVILHAVKGAKQDGVIVSSSEGPDDEDGTERTVAFEEVVRSTDPQRFIHLVSNRIGRTVSSAVEGQPARLQDLAVTVSTGKVVDFRAKEHLRKDAGPSDWPLIYPSHFDAGSIRWPKPGKKPNGLAKHADTDALLLPVGVYVLVKRFTSKEEDRRVVASLFEPTDVQSTHVAFENHLNVFHAGGAGLERDLAVGLAIYLNSTIVDTYLRQFSGHTQVNATDLRTLRYPTATTLKALGRAAGSSNHDQDSIDRLVDDCLGLGGETAAVTMTKKVRDALEILKALGMPRQQQNERSALTLLALLGLAPNTRWRDAKAPLMGITPIMDFMRDQYGKEYKPNTRETVRRQTVHQFVEAALVVANPDEPNRPVNSPKAVYQVAPAALQLLRKFGTPKWQSALEGYLASVGTLSAKYARERAMTRLPVALPNGTKLSLSPGGQNELVKQILEEFCPRFTPGAEVIYIGDAADKFAMFEEDALRRLGVEIEPHGKMPDVVVYQKNKKWLILVEAVTSHGPVNAKRHDELRRLFGSAKPGLVYVTAFLSREKMARYVGEISWETEVWVADAPDHLIHFDGERFLGPYDK